MRIIFLRNEELNIFIGLKNCFNDIILWYYVISEKLRSKADGRSAIS